MQLFRMWLQKADHDLRSAKKLSSGEEPLLDTAIYHTQQCAEKALKAYLAYRTQPLQKTHDLELLVELCEQLDCGFKRIMDDAVTLSPYVQEFRYPGDCLEPEMQDVTEAITCAENILDFVNDLIGPNTDNATD